MSAHLLLWLPLAGSGLLGPAGPWLGRTLPPATAVRLLPAAMIVSALASGFVLAVAGFVAVAQLPLVAVIGQWSVAVLRTGDPTPVVGGCLAGLVMLALLGAAVRRAFRSARDLLLAGWVCLRLGPAAGGLVVVDDDDPDAYALPGLRGRVVVSTAMLRALPADERQVLLAHEVAHLRRRHHLSVQLAELAAAANPLLRPAARGVAAAVERDADEVAAAEVGDRLLTARALARAGLARSAARRRSSAPAAALAGVAGPVVERARALLGAPPPPRRVLAAALTALTLTSAAAAAATAHQAEHRFELAQLVYRTSR